MKTESPLDSVKLKYEDMEIKVPKTAARINKVPKAAKTDTVKRKAKPSALAQLKSKISNQKPQPKKTSKLSKKAQLELKRAGRAQMIRGIIGIGLLLVVVSIARSTLVTFQFVDGVANVIYLLPQIIFAVAISILAFLKLYK